MNTIQIIFRFLLTAICLLGTVFEMNGQLFKKLGKAAERAAERTVERRVEQETSEKTDQALDSIFEPGAKGENERREPIPNGGSTGDAQIGGPDSGWGTNSGRDSETADTPDASSTGDPKSIAVYSKFDFVPGDNPIFTDDFTKDFIGDFPSKWNSNASGELVTIEGYPEKWLKILPGPNTTYIPDVTDLPEEFTLEFDVVATGLDNQTSSQSYLGLMVGDNNTFDKPKNCGMIEYPFCQYIGRGIIVENNFAGKRVMRNELKTDIRNIINEKHHISIAVNKQRFRFWINENKYVDVPRLLPENMKMQGIKFTLRDINTEKEAVFIGNIKIAEGGVDLRRKLLADGKISTNGILFDSGSANIQPQSMGIIRQIFQVLQQESTINLKIVGHTDADGDESTNLQLSKQRAEAVKNALVNVYNVPPDKLTTEGKGESEPVGDNQTNEGKSRNRRVEFIKL
ncbi:OmpA family protein [Pricia sp.]|uniref:OmpA family protein n=1 Tax=Pricia sp. TaxID=2268138 RepID=UPI003593166F